MMRRMLFTVTTMVVLAACSAPRQIQNTEAIDPAWAGRWQASSLTVESKKAAKEVVLEIEFSSTTIKVFYTDTEEKLDRFQVFRPRLDGDRITFEVRYESERGLPVITRYNGQRLGKTMMIDFTGSEGGRGFRGKIQAIRAQVPIPATTTQPRDSTSGASN